MPTEKNIHRKGTDKVKHGYIEPYSEHLPTRDAVRAMLEIGVAEGASAEMWRRWYPDADIHLIDLFLAPPPHVGMKWCRDNGFVPYQLDQSEVLELGMQIRTKYEIIVDDGSHRADHQLISFKQLFWNNLRSGGVYAIEDCQCNKDKFYNGNGRVKDFTDTALATFKKFKETSTLINPYFSEAESRIFQEMIGRVEILADEKLILIWRK